jgi:hypothetical protein
MLENCFLCDFVTSGPTLLANPHSATECLYVHPCYVSRYTIIKNNVGLSCIFYKILLGELQRVGKPTSMFLKLGKPALLNRFI